MAKDRVTLSALWQQARAMLKDADVEMPDRTAQWLFQHASEYSLHDFVMRQDEPVQAEIADRFLALIARRQAREPLQYLLNEAEFAGLLFYVDQRVLIPRYDTQVLLHVAQEAIAEKEGEVVVVDIGTGSGAIAIALSVAQKDKRQLRMYATDISPDALAVAKINARRHGVIDAITFLQGSYVTALPIAEHKIDVLIANPPYISPQEREMMQPEVALYEPALALFAEHEGYIAYETIIAQTQTRMDKEGVIALEVGIDQAEHVKALLLATFPKADVRFYQDDQGIDRVVCARLKGY
nr:peptide chain release factor N(5)-glutamine methyltransferase [Bacilli bacterium]